MYITCINSEFRIVYDYDKYNSHEPGQVVMYVLNYKVTTLDLNFLFYSQKKEMMEAYYKEIQDKGLVNQEQKEVQVLKEGIGVKGEAETNTKKQNKRRKKKVREKKKTKTIETREKKKEIDSDKGDTSEEIGVSESEDTAVDMDCRGFESTEIGEGENEKSNEEEEDPGSKEQRSKKSHNQSVLKKHKIASDEKSGKIVENTDLRYTCFLSNFIALRSMMNFINSFYNRKKKQNNNSAPTPKSYSSNKYDI
jgi:hypothetical protein